MKSRRGFTLVELLIVIAIMAVATTLAVSAFRSMNDNWAYVDARVELEQRASRIFEQIRRDCAASISPAQTDVHATVVDQFVESEVQPFYGIVFDNDRLTIPVISPTGPDEKESPIRVGYYIDRETLSGTLMRQFGELYGDEIVEGGIVVDENILEFDVEFASPDGHTWLSQWDREGHPSAIRVSILLHDKNDRTVQISRYAVFQIAGGSAQ